jgi:hypothetical protein
MWRLPQRRSKESRLRTRISYSKAFFKGSPAISKALSRHRSLLHWHVAGNQRCLHDLAVLTSTKKRLWKYARLGNAPDPVGAVAADKPPMAVHPWTPVGSSKYAALRRPVIDRYIAAVDIKGNNSIPCHRCSRCDIRTGDGRPCLPEATRRSSPGHRTDRPPTIRLIESDL